MSEEGFVRISKKKALELTVALWEWIEENPLKKKHEWPGWKANGIRGYFPYCACCFYVDYRDSVNKYGADDRSCPLYAFWLKYPVDEAENACVGKETPFSKWHEAAKRKDAEEARENARAIKLGAMEELTRLYGEKAPEKPTATDTRPGAACSRLEPAL